MASRYHTPRVLVIDDDLDTLTLLRMVLKRGGLDVKTASCWEETIDRVNLAKETRQPFDVIILDIMMPERSGFDVYHSLQVVLDQMPPVIFLTAKYSMEDMVKASDLGAAKYLTKPTTPEKLLEAVRDVVSQSR